MSKFYGCIPASGSARRNDATARGHHGITTQAASWAGAIETRVWHDEATDKDVFEVRQIPWHGHGVSCVVASGVVGEADA